MKALLQRTTQASVTIAAQEVGSIKKGIVVLLGIEKNDTQEIAEKCLQKLLNYRIFSDDEGKINLSAKDIDADLLIVSQFTLAADTKKGLRPGFSTAAPPQEAKALYHFFVNQCQALTQGTKSKVATGSFGADMQVALINDGPVTFLLEFSDKNN